MEIPAYILEGEVRFFSQELLEEEHVEEHVEEHGIFFCPDERPRHLDVLERPQLQERLTCRLSSDHQLLENSASRHG